MSAGLSFSITALLPTGTSERDQEAVLLGLARRRPAIVFHDVLRGPRGTVAAVVRVEQERIVRLGPKDERPPHVGDGVGTAAREHFDVLVDHGDVLLVGWGEHAEVAIGTDRRVVADLDEVSGVVDETIWELRREEDPDPDYERFLRTLAEAIAVARLERLPIVAHW